jgi:TATA-binding protein-associated factor
MLIRVAPLVPVQGDASGDNAVIRHLIHGKPLPPVEVGAALAAKMKGVVLRKYQSEGVTWLNFLMDVNLNGILSDEMGLGKTLQSLVAIAMRHEKEKAGQEGVSLIVCPSTLVDHWVGEVGKFFKDGVFRCVGYGGGVKERREKKKLVEAGGVNLIVTSYSVLR